MHTVQAQHKLWGVAIRDLIRSLGQLQDSCCTSQLPRGHKGIHMKVGREQSMQVLHMMAVENKAPHLSHRYHVYVTYYRLIIGLLGAKRAGLQYSTNVTVTPGTTSTSIIDNSTRDESDDAWNS